MRIISFPVYDVESDKKTAKWGDDIGILMQKMMDNFTNVSCAHAVLLLVLVIGGIATST